MRHIPKLIILIVLSFFIYLAYQKFFGASLPVYIDNKYTLKFNLPDGYTASQSEDVLDQEEIKIKVFNFNNNSSIEIELVDTKPETEISQTFYYTPFNNKFLTFTSITEYNSPEKIQELEKVRNEITKSLVLIPTASLINYCSQDISCTYLENYKSSAKNKHQLEFLDKGNRLVTYPLSSDKSLYYERLSILDNKLVILKREKEKFINKVSILDMNTAAEEELDLKLPQEFKIMDMYVNEKLIWIFGSLNCEDLICEKLPKELYVYNYETKEIQTVAKYLFRNMGQIILMNVQNNQANFLVNGNTVETAQVYQLNTQTKVLTSLFDGSKDSDSSTNYYQTISKLNLKVYQFLSFSKEKGAYFEREIEPDFFNTYRPNDLFKTNFY